MTANEKTAIHARLPGECSQTKKTTFEYARNVKLNEGRQKNGEEKKRKEIPSMLQNTNILKQAKGGFDV